MDMMILGRGLPKSIWSSRIDTLVSRPHPGGVMYPARGARGPRVRSLAEGMKVESESGHYLAGGRRDSWLAGKPRRQGSGFSSGTPPERPAAKATEGRPLLPGRRSRESGRTLGFPTAVEDRSGPRVVYGRPLPGGADDRRNHRGG